MGGEDTSEESHASIHHDQKVVRRLPSQHASSTVDDDAAGFSPEPSSLFGSNDSCNVSSSSDVPASSSLTAAIDRLCQLPRPNASVDQEETDARDEETADVVPTTVRLKCVGRNGSTAWGSASLVGRRSEMEDDLTAGPSFLNVSCESFEGCLASMSPGSGEPSQVLFFGVYDGHGGAQVARYCGTRLHEALMEEWGRRREMDGYEGATWKKRWEEILTRTFVRVDKELAGEPSGSEPIAPEIVGSTAVVVVLSRCQIVAANCGDSRAVLCRGGQAVALTSDHKPVREDELARIEAAGGRVINWYGPRVNGVLAMSRAIGDRYLRPCIIPVPEITFTERSDDDDCLIVASDGLWEVFSNEEACHIARACLRRLKRAAPRDDGVLPSQAVADHLCSLAYQRCSSDNISVIVVDLKARRCRRRQVDTSTTPETVFSTAKPPPDTTGLHNSTFSP